MNRSKPQPGLRTLSTVRLSHLIGTGMALVGLIAGCAQIIPATAPITPTTTKPVITTPVVVTVTTPVSPPVTMIPTLPTPSVRPAAGTVPYGTVVRLAVDSLPPGTLLELSTDNGLRWLTADSLVLTSATNLLVRSRRDTYASAVGATVFAVGFKRVLVVGNSITMRASDPTIGWLGNWGMAASAPANDYVHKLTQRLKSLDPAVVVNTYDGVAFENQFWTFDYRNVRSAAAFKPDLVIMRIAENVPAGSVSSQNFKQHYARLIDSLTAGNPLVKVVCTTSFFAQTATSEAIRQVATERNFYLADFNPLVDNRAFQAYDKFKDPGVAAHPGDVGMQAITDLIWDKVH